MAKAHVETSTGTKITIEGDAAEVATIVSQIHSPVPVAEPDRRSPKRPQQKRASAGYVSASDRINNLKGDGFFNQPKTLAAVASELEKSGYLYPVTSLSGIMLTLVQKRILSRAKKDGVWVYGKR